MDGCHLRCISIRQEIRKQLENPTSFLTEEEEEMGYM
jgi:hypothetical protein